MLRREATANYSIVRAMRGSRFWRWRQPSAGVAFTNHSIVALNIANEARSGETELPGGLIESSAVTPNIQSVGELAQIVERALADVGVARERLALVLPDLATTTVVLPARERSRRPARELRRELAAGLPYPVGEARCDFWRGQHDEILGVAVRTAVVQQYERIVEAVDCQLGWVDSASVCHIPSQVSRRVRAERLEVHAQLYADHYCLTVVRGGELIDTRIKLRSAGDFERVAREVLRAPVLHDSETIDSLHLSGKDAAAVAELLRDAGVGEVRVDCDGERQHLVSSIERLLERGTP
jgi:Tfp pilus assembly PilM family ATPase